MENKKDKISDILTQEWPLLLLITIYFLYEFGTIGQYLAFAIFPLLIIKNEFWRYLDATCVWIIVFSVSYALITTLYGFTSDAKGNIPVFSFFPLMFYLTGRYLADKWYSQIYFLFLLLIIPLGLMVCSGIVTDILQNGFLNKSRETVVSGSISAATIYGVRLSLWTVSFGMIFSFAQDRVEKIYKTLLVVLGAIGIVCTAHMINRTGIVLAAVGILAIMLTNIARYSFQKIIIGAIFLAFIGYGVYSSTNDSELLTSYLSRESESGAESYSAGGRTERWKDGLEKIYTQPMGGGVFKGGRRYYAHNFWLDVSEMAGILPLIALMGCTIINLRKNYMIIRSRRVSSFFSSWLIILNIGFFLTCGVEPIMEGIAAYAFLLFFFWGITSIIYTRIQIIEEIN